MKNPWVTGGPWQDPRPPNSYLFCLCLGTGTPQMEDPMDRGTGHLSLRTRRILQRQGITDRVSLRGRDLRVLNSSLISTKTMSGGPWSRSLVVTSHFRSTSLDFNTRSSPYRLVRLVGSSYPHLSSLSPTWETQKERFNGVTKERIRCRRQIGWWIGSELILSYKYTLFDRVSDPSQPGSGEASLDSWVGGTYM